MWYVLISHEKLQQCTFSDETNQTLDVEFRDAFLLTYRTYMTSNELFHLLLQRYPFFLFKYLRNIFEHIHIFIGFGVLLIIYEFHIFFNQNITIESADQPTVQFRYEYYFWVII